MIVPLWTGAPEGSISREAWEYGVERGRDAAENCEIDEDEDGFERYEQEAFEAEQRARDYSPWEHFSARLNACSEEESAAAWEQYELGVQRGIKLGLAHRLIEGYQEFCDAYIECALWSSTDNSSDDGGDPLDDNYGEEDIDLAGKMSMLADCADFMEANKEHIGEAYANAGHDFWLTRNGHGAGFWDGDWPDAAGEALTEASRPYGSVDLYVHEGTVFVAGSEVRPWPTDEDAA